MSDCIFCHIIQGNIPADKLYEDANILAFYDAYPVAETHVLIVPKKHITSLNHLEKIDVELAGKINLAIAKIAQMLGVEEGYKTLINTGEKGGQTVMHLHYHILAGNFLKKDALLNT